MPTARKFTFVKDDIVMYKEIQDRRFPEGLQLDC